MKLEFDLDHVSVVEFGVGRDGGNEQSFVAVPVDVAVQTALQEMVRETWDTLLKEEDGPVKYEPSEKHAATEYLFLPLEDDLAALVRDLHNAANLDIQASALADADDVFCYFARLTDQKKQRVTALRRATQFKGIVKRRNRLVRMIDNTLKIIEDTVFKLDNDFDLLIDATNVHILRPSGFEFAGNLQQAILDAVPENIKAIRKEIPFVEFDSIEQYACKHPRAARYLTSIRGQEETKSTDKSLLKKLCKQTGVEVEESKGKVNIAVGHEMGFLEVLDRRRYQVSLVMEKPERYRAASRRQIKEG